MFTDHQYTRSNKIFFILLCLFVVALLVGYACYYFYYMRHDFLKEWSAADKTDEEAYSDYITEYGQTQKCEEGGGIMKNTAMLAISLIAMYWISQYFFKDLAAWNLFKKNNISCKPWKGYFALHIVSTILIIFNAMWVYPHTTNKDGPTQYVGFLVLAVVFGLWGGVLVNIDRYDKSKLQKLKEIVQNSTSTHANKVEDAKKLVKTISKVGTENELTATQISTLCKIKYEVENTSIGRQEIWKHLSYTGKAGEQFTNWWKRHFWVKFLKIPLDGTNDPCTAFAPLLVLSSILTIMGGVMYSKEKHKKEEEDEGEEEEGKKPSHMGFHMLVGGLVFTLLFATLCGVNYKRIKNVRIKNVCVYEDPKSTLQLDETSTELYDHVCVGEWWNGSWLNIMRIMAVSGSMHFIAYLFSKAPFASPDPPDKCASYTAVERVNLTASLSTSLIIFVLILVIIKRGRSTSKEGAVTFSPSAERAQYIIGTENVSLPGEWWKLICSREVWRAWATYVIVFAVAGHVLPVLMVRYGFWDKVRKVAVFTSYNETKMDTSGQSNVTEKEEQTKSVVFNAMINDVVANIIMIIMLSKIVPGTGLVKHH